MKNKKLLAMLCVTLLLVCCMATPAFAAGDVAGAIEGTWNDASGQIKTVVNNVVFPAIDLIVMHSYAFLASSMQRFFRDAKAVKKQNRFFGGLLMAVGAALFFVKRGAHAS